jgi:ubiquinone/menaquinone biosynthesis C-methylase UbiE
MKTKYDAREIRGLFERGENIVQWIRSREGAKHNSPTAIAYSYDMQAGSYFAELEDPLILDLKQRLGRRLASVLDGLAPQSLLDAGVGEATSLVPTLAIMASPPAQVLGFDLSLSRLLYARRHLIEHGRNDVTLFVGELDRIPLADSSVDVVLTLHAVEPNRGQEEAILAELLRVARHHLVMVEPCYEQSGEETQAWIDRHGYVRGLPETLERLGHKARLIERFGVDQNPVNQAFLFIADKAGGEPARAGQFISPISGRPLVRRSDCWFCPDDGHAFPVIRGIPCLTVENAVLVSKLDQFDR